MIGYYFYVVGLVFAESAKSEFFKTSTQGHMSTEACWLPYKILLLRLDVSVSSLTSQYQQKKRWAFPMGVVLKSKLQSTTYYDCFVCSDRKLFQVHRCCCFLQTIEKRRHGRDESTVLCHEDGWLPAPFSKIIVEQFYGGSNCIPLLQSSISPSGPPMYTPSQCIMCMSHGLTLARRV